MKKVLCIGVSMLSLLLITQKMFSQPEKSAYKMAIEAYNAKDYSTAATQFNVHLQQGKEKLSNTQLYTGACILALHGNVSESYELLHYLATTRFLSNFDHLVSDTDLQTLHAIPEWPALLARVEQNKRTLPERTRVRVRRELLKAKALLEKDNSTLWGENFWTDSIIVLGNDNTVYALYPMAESVTTDSLLYTKTIPNNVLSQSNTAQQFEGKRHAIVLTSYLSDSSATILHELFHVHQFKKATFLGDPVPYLDQHDARELLRLEYAALRQAFEVILADKSTTLIKEYVEDALLFRKVRQGQYASYLDKELQIETLEGLANYTGFVLSTWGNKYEKAIQEINSREQAETYTRPFPYATGLAYGLLFDYLKLPWKKDPWQVYNFLSIYEQFNGIVSIQKEKLQHARMRNNYTMIHAEELKRKEENEKLIAFYTESLITQPVLRATLQMNTNYSLSFDMNGTLVLEGKGIVYSAMTGTDASGKNFGNFKTVAGKDKLGLGGVLYSEDRIHLTFPLPLSVEGNVIKGACYEIELAEGWKVVKANDKGDMEIIRK